jgi:hypothetical protein
MSEEDAFLNKRRRMHAELERKETNKFEKSGNDLKKKFPIMKYL